MKNRFKSFGNRAIVAYMAILIILLCGTVHATTDDAGITSIADQISEYVKQEITKTLPTITKNEDIVKKVEDKLSEKTVNEEQIKSIVDNLKKALNLPFNVASVEKIVGVVHGTIISVLTEGTESDKKIKELKKEINEKFENLEAAKQPKMLSPHKDVNFLFETVIGDIYYATTKKDYVTFKEDEQIGTIKKITLNYSWWNKLFGGEPGVTLTMEDNKTITITTTPPPNSNINEHLRADKLAPILELKMQAVEKTLNIESKPSDTLKKRISRAYEEVNNKDWQNDDLRFGVLTSYLPDANAIATSIAVHSYFGYRRFTPGEIFDAHNFFRRASVFFAVGTGNAMDSSSGKSADIKGTVLSAGIGFDIVKGFALSAGVSIFSYKAPADQDYNLKNSPTFGITLNSDLWRTLFNNK